MKNLLLSYSQYNLWANQKITDFLKTLNDDQLAKEIPGSFPSIKKTFIHTWDAQLIWLARLHNTSFTFLPGRDFNGTFEEAIAGFLESSQELIDFVESSSENFLRTSLTYKNLAGETYKNNISDIIQHVMNHGTYHRGQIINMLRQLGFTKLFSTDYITFCREAVEVKE